MKNKILLLAIIILFASCHAKTHIDFIINWDSIISAIGYILLGVAIVLIIIIIIFKDFRLF